jgi:hypothetical protein
MIMFVDVGISAPASDEWVVTLTVSGRAVAFAFHQQNDHTAHGRRASSSKPSPKRPVNRSASNRTRWTSFSLTSNAKTGRRADACGPIRPCERRVAFEGYLVGIGSWVLKTPPLASSSAGQRARRTKAGRRCRMKAWRSNRARERVTRIPVGADAMKAGAATQHQPSPQNNQTATITASMAAPGLTRRRPSCYCIRTGD